MTAWTIVWGNDNNESQQRRLDWIRDDASPEAFAAEVVTGQKLIRYSYRLTERREEGVVHALYAFAIAVDGHVQMSVYFDDEADLPTARQIWQSLEETPGG